MTVDFPALYPATTPLPSQPVDVQTLQETFTALLRNYGADKGGYQTNTILEVIRPDQSNTEEKDRNYQQRENRQHSTKNDSSQTDKKMLDRSEIRKGEMSTDYQNHTDRQEILRNDYREKVEHGTLTTSALQSLTPSATPPLESAKPSEPVPNLGHSPPQQRSVPEIVGTNNQVPAVNVPTTNVDVPNSSATNGQANVVMPMSINVVPMSMPTSVASPNVPPQMVTIFTPSGRFGQHQENADDNEDEREDKDEEKEREKKQPFAVFESIRMETTRPIQRNHVRQQKEPTSQTQTFGKTHAKPKEVKPESSRSVKTIDNLLNAPAQNVAVQKKGEPKPDQMQCIKRIAAACEAASQYAPIRLKINLDHLGTLSLRFFHKADKLSLRFETPSKESAKFLSEHLDGLRTILANRNIKIADIEILQE